MPVLQPCAEVGCPELVERGRCPAHTQSKNAARGTTKERGYAGTWKALRLMVLRRDMYVCQECLRREGRTERAVDVDHIIAMSAGGAARDMNNLESLCRACHNKKTRAENKSGRLAPDTPAPGCK